MPQCLEPVNISLHMQRDFADGINVTYLEVRKCFGVNVSLKGHMLGTWSPMQQD